MLRSWINPGRDDLQEKSTVRRTGTTASSVSSRDSLSSRRRATGMKGYRQSEFCNVQLTQL